MTRLSLILISAFLLSSCGVKPGGVDGKPGHPKTYPDVSTDPKP